METNWNKPQKGSCVDSSHFETSDRNVNVEINVTESNIETRR